MPTPSDLEIVAVPLWLLDDLMCMARKSDQYRAGYAWTAVAMSRANRIMNGAMYRLGTSEK